MENRPIRDGYGKHWEWKGNKPYWWCPDNDLCGPHPTRKAAKTCFEARNNLEDRRRSGDNSPSGPHGSGHEWI